MRLDPVPLCGLGLLNLYAASDAFALAHGLRRKESIAPWQPGRGMAQRFMDWM